jgi:hypothetical protein
MINIGELLKDYQGIKNPNVEKTRFVEALNKKYNLNIKENQVFFRKNTLILKITATQKNFVFMKKNEILELVGSVCPEQFIDTIRF